LAAKSRISREFDEERTTESGELEKLIDVDVNWALIFSDTGDLQGVFIPEGYTEDDTPASLVAIIKMFKTEQGSHHATTHQYGNVYH
jgi:hypothetical protein